MDSYLLGLILGSILQPSTIVALLLAIFLKKKRRPLILIIIFIICLGQWILIGGGNLGFGSFAIPLIASFILVYIISFFKNDKNISENKDKENIKKNKKDRMPWIIAYPIYLFLIVIVIYMITLLPDVYHNEIKPLIKGYSTIDQSRNLQFNGEDIDEDIMMYIHHFNDLNLDNKSIVWVDSTILNDYFYKCIDNEKNFDISCLANNDQPYLIDDKCSWTFFGHTLVANYKNYYLVNIEEKACGTMTARFNSFYLINYDGKNLKIDNVIPSGRYPQRQIRFYKIEDSSFKFVTEACYHGADTCRGNRSEWLEFKFL